MGEKFNENLREARKKKRMTQKQVAEAIGVARSTYALYETGEREPTVEGVKKIAKALDVSGDFLIGITEPTQAQVEFELMCAKYGVDRLAYYLSIIRKLKS